MFFLLETEGILCIHSASGETFETFGVSPVTCFKGHLRVPFGEPLAGQVLQYYGVIAMRSAALVGFSINYSSEAHENAASLDKRLNT